MLEACISECSGAARIKLHVHPGAKRNGISGFFGDSVKFDLQTPPVDGKANAALLKQLSKLLDCPKSAIIKYYFYYYNAIFLQQKQQKNFYRLHFGTATRL